MRLISRTAVSRQVGNQPAGCLGRLQGSLVAIVTPFRHGNLDGGAFQHLCERQVRRGTAGLVVCGSTGEASSLSLAEHGRVVAMALEAAAGRVPVIAGCGAPATEAAVHLGVSAARNGAAALLCAPPPYVRPTQDGVVAHVRAVSRGADLPIVLYDVPSRTGVEIADATVARLFEGGLIAGLKDAGGDLSRPVQLRALCGDDLVQFSGDDATAAAYRAMGGHGCISVTANVAPALCAGMHRAWRDGDLGEFGRLRDLLAPLHQSLFAESNPIPVKAALEMAGLCDGEVRLPLTGATEATLNLLGSVLSPIMEVEDEAAGTPRLSLVP